MANALFLGHPDCGRCKQFEAKCQIPEMEPILCTQPMEFVHADYVGMEGYCGCLRKAGVEERTSDSGSFHLVRPGFVTNNHTAHTTA